MADERLAVVAQPGASLNRKLRQPLYDTETYPAAPPAGYAMRLFVNPMGSNMTATAVQKTELHTNMQLSGQLAPPNRFWLAGFRVELEPACSYLSHLAVYPLAVFKFFFGANPWLTIPLCQIPQGVSIDGFGGAVQYMRQGQSSPIMYDFRIESKYHPIYSGESFHVEITFPSGHNDPYIATLIRCYLLGFMDSQL